MKILNKKFVHFCALSSPNKSDFLTYISFICKAAH
uniref:Uncharacterized protein n=1 Tax=Anguilla anguilla TaxID=7936 RepID=A0A0E9QUN2_ANGAN